MRVRASLRLPPGLSLERQTRCPVRCLALSPRSMPLIHLCYRSAAVQILCLRGNFGRRPAHAGIGGPALETGHSDARGASGGIWRGPFPRVNGPPLSRDNALDWSPLSARPPRRCHIWRAKLSDFASPVTGALFDKVLTNGQHAKCEKRPIALSAKAPALQRMTQRSPDPSGRTLSIAWQKVGIVSAPAMVRRAVPITAAEKKSV